MKNYEEIVINTIKQTIQIRWLTIPYTAFSYLWNQLRVYNHWYTDFNLWHHKIYINNRLRWAELTPFQKQYWSKVKICK